MLNIERKKPSALEHQKSNKKSYEINIAIFKITSMPNIGFQWGVSIFFQYKRETRGIVKKMHLKTSIGRFHVTLDWLKTLCGNRE